MQWVFAQNVAEALANAEPGARYVGGGLSIMLLLQRGADVPTRLIDLSKLPLRHIEKRGSRLYIGSQVRLFELGQDPLVRAASPILSQAVQQIATPAIRNQSTIGGELLARPRCPLFLDVSNPRCNKRTAHSGCAALEVPSGALLGASAACVARGSSELAVSLGALSADAHLLSKDRPQPRIVPVLDLYCPPGDTPQREFALLPGELLTEVSLPWPASEQRLFGYARLADTMFEPLACAAVMLEMKDGLVADVRVVLGGVATTPVRAWATEQALRGQALSKEKIEEAARRVVQNTQTAVCSGSFGPTPNPERSVLKTPAPDFDARVCGCIHVVQQALLCARRDHGT